MSLVYLDANATEPLRAAARDAAFAAMALAGNPSSIHAAGRAARKILETARETVAQFCAARPSGVVFCSGATEANALALHALGRGRRILIGATEHDSIRAAVPDAIILPVSRDGTVAPEILDDVLARHPNALVALMAANNETGVLHDIASAAGICAAHGALLHVDAAQTMGRCCHDYLAMGATSLSLSGHKFGAPMGAGALILRSGTEIEALTKGGGQEQGRRGGTPSLPAIAGLAAALGEPYDSAKIAAWRDEIEHFCAGFGAIAAGAAAPRLPNTTNLALPGIRAETQLIALDIAGIAVSAGSACSSGKLAASHVLTAMGYGDLASQAIRISLPWNVTAADVEKFRDAYAAMAKHACERRNIRLNERSLPIFAPGFSPEMPKMTFIERNGQPREVDAPLGLSVLEVAHKHGVDIEGACEGSLACSTCHVIVAADWYGKLRPAAEEEEDMLDVAFGLQKTSRLGCQLVITEALDGLTVTLPPSKKAG